MAERVEWALRKAALWEEVKDKLNQSGNSLSGGQQQRLCIARGIAVKPEVVLLDEPCLGARPDLHRAHRRTDPRAKEDYTIVIVTHNMQQAARVSDYTAYMYLGELIEFGAPTTFSPSRSARKPRITLPGVLDKLAPGAMIMTAEHSSKQIRYRSRSDAHARARDGRAGRGADSCRDRGVHGQQSAQVER